jgi:hypothetical protein
MYNKIIDEAMFIARASEGAVSMEWILTQPIAIRKKYVEQFTEELKERQKRMQNMNNNKGTSRR